MIRDRNANHWKTVCWGLDDPGYDNDGVWKATDAGIVVGGQDETSRLREEPVKVQAQEDLDREAPDLDDLASTFDHLDIPIPDDKLFFESHCVLNETAAARQILEQHEHPASLINEPAYRGSKPILHATCEEGHLEMIRVLLEFSPSLEIKDLDGNTAVQTAINWGYGTVGLCLLQAGARNDLVDHKGKTLHAATAKVLEKQEELARLERQMLQIQSSKESTKHRLHKREDEIAALKTIIEQCEVREMGRKATAILQQITKIHGADQAAYFDQHGVINHAKFIQKVVEEIFTMPRNGKSKTVACLVRGTVLPYVFAVSGYTGDPGSKALDRSVWITRVLRLAEIMDYTMSEHEYDDADKSCSYYACHSEKQLLAKFLWDHTSVFNEESKKSNDGGDDDDDDNDTSSSNRRPAPPSWPCHPVEIFLCQPGLGKAEVCSDCSQFCRSAAKFFGLKIFVNGVSQSGVLLLRSFG